MTYVLILVTCAVVAGGGYFFRRLLPMIGAAAVAIIATIYFSIMIVQPGMVGFLKTFGNLSYTTYAAGFHMVNPFSSQLTWTIQRQAFNYTGEDTAEGLTKNRVALLVDVTVPYILNPAAAPHLYERYGANWNLIDPSSRNAIRDCTASLDWEDAVGEIGRATMATCIPEKIQTAVVADLVDAGFTQEEAAEAFIFPNALVRRMLPKEERILAAVAEEQAAIVDLRRQVTLSEIAEVEATRRAKDGMGIRMMMEELPSNFTVAEMVAMIQANAMKTNAEAFMRAVEGGNPNITVITGGSNEVPVAARAN
jgi:regulator of protease activity HflC (stomatin/prohibitin superfamily)